MKALARQRILSCRAGRTGRGRGFTLLELMVAMAITTLIITVLVSITAISLDAWRRSRSQVRAARQSRAALETMARDFESMLVRSGNNYEWLVAELDSGSGGKSSEQAANAARFVFFNSATDRYDGEIGTDKDEGGDVSAVGYRLVYKDPIRNTTSTSGADNYPVFVLYRNLVSPREAFDRLLAQGDLQDAYDSAFGSRETESNNFVVENIYELTVTFVIEYESNDVLKTKRASIVSGGGGSSATSRFVIAGDGIQIGAGDSGGTADSGRVVAVDLAITVLSDFGMQQLEYRADDAIDDIIREYGYHYAKSVIVPQP